MGHGRAADPQPADAAAAGRARRHARPDRDLPGHQRRAAHRARLGRRDVHRHRVRARRARPGRRQPPAGPGAHLPADLLGRRRPGRDRGHRDLLQQRRQGGAADHRRGAARGERVHQAPRRAQRPRLPGHRAGRLGGVLQVGDRPDRHRAGHRAADLRVPGGAAGPRAGHRRVPAVPGATHCSAGGRSPGSGPHVDLAQRAAAGPVPPVDELRDRPAVRAGQRRDPDQRLVPGEGVHLPGHARHHDRLPGRASRSAPRAARGWSARSPRGGSLPRSAGARSSASARWPASGSPSRC